MTRLWRFRDFAGGSRSALGVVILDESYAGEALPFFRDADGRANSAMGVFEVPYAGGNLPRYRNAHGDSVKAMGVVLIDDAYDGSTLPMYTDADGQSHSAMGITLITEDYEGDLLGTFTDASGKRRHVLGSVSLDLATGEPVGEGGGSAYTASAVHFDGANSSLSNASVSCTDGPDFSLSFWYKAGASADKIVFVSDPNNFETHFVFGEGDFLIQVADGTGDGIKFGIIPNSLPAINLWHHVLFSVETNHPAGEKIAALYVDDIAVPFSVNDLDPSFVTAINGEEFILGTPVGHGDGLTGDVADFWLATGQSLLTGADIAQATRRKFISAAGKPVYLGADGSTPTGVAPPIFLSGNGTDFRTNRGTGGAFTLTGTLTNASTSPSD